jgi:Glu-tRNA(Gln) amidotransferase subunit E-like FAD-binding protein
MTEMRHVVLGAAGQATAVAIAVARLALVPVRPLARVPPVRRLASRPVAALAASGAEAERRLLESARRAVDSGVLDDLADRLVASDRTAALVTHVLGGPLTDRVAAIVVERALTSPQTEELISRTLERPELERLIVLALDSPATDRIVRRVLATPGVELAVTRVLESELLDAATARFLESEEIERVIERIAHGPELRAAVAAQSAGLADLVADEVRGRSRSGDEVAERLARSLVPRRWRHGGPAGAAGT